MSFSRMVTLLLLAAISAGLGWEARGLDQDVLLDGIRSQAKQEYLALLPPGFEADFITPGGIPVYVVAPDPIDKFQVGLYLDAAEASLRSQGIDIPVAKVFLWAPGTLSFDLDGDGYRETQARGGTFMWRPQNGLSVVWYAHNGAVAYAHERLHNAGFSERAIAETDIDEVATSVAKVAAFHGGRKNKAD